MYRVLQALLLAAIAGYIAWITVDLHDVHDQLLRLQQTVAADRHIRSDSSRNHHASRGDAPDVDVTVAGLSYVFKPEKLVVKVGTRVTWTNLTAARHSVTSVGAHFFDRFVRPHGHISVLFSSIGAFPYYCRYHPYQKGEIVVVP